MFYKFADKHKWSYTIWMSDKCLIFVKIMCPKALIHFTKKYY